MKYNETMITENKTVRDEMINRVDVLNKVKSILTLPMVEVMTMQQVADFYEVPMETIDTCYKTHKNEIDMDGVTTMTPKTYKEFLNGLGSTVKKSDVYTQLNGKMVIHIDSNIDVIIPNRGIKVFPTRAVLRIGMLLTQSAIAKEVRTQLLNVYEVAKEDNPEIVTQEINKEQSLYIEFTQKLIGGDTKGMLMAFQNIVDYHNRHTLELEQQIDRIETANQMLTTELMTISDRSTLSRVMRCLANKTQKSYAVTWNEFYTFLIYKEHINLKKRGKKPYVNHIRDDEWKAVQKSLLGYIEKNNLNATEFIRSCEIVK